MLELQIHKKIIYKLSLFFNGRYCVPEPETVRPPPPIHTKLSCYILIFTFLFCFIVWNILYSAIVIYRKKGLEKFKTSKQLLYFKMAYNIDIDKIDIKKFATKLSLVNGFIISTVVTIISLFDSFIIKIIVGFLIFLSF